MTSNSFELEILNGKFNSDFIEMNHLGEGGYGNVLKVKSIADQSLYAIKKIWIRDKRHDDLMRREVQLISGIQNESVVKFMTAWVEESGETFAYIQLELCHDHLRRILNVKRLAFNRETDIMLNTTEYFISVELFREVTESLNYLHSQKPPILHRDLKPENVLVHYGDKCVKLKLCDFGLSKLHEKSSHSVGQGTDDYIAPEVKKSRTYNLKADIYSMAIFAYEIFDFKGDSRKVSQYSNELVEKFDKVHHLLVSMKALLPDKRPDCTSILKKIKDLDFDNQVKSKHKGKENDFKQFTEFFQKDYESIALNEEKFFIEYFHQKISNRPLSVILDKHPNRVFENLMTKVENDCRDITRKHLKGFDLGVNFEHLKIKYLDEYRFKTEKMPKINNAIEESKYNLEKFVDRKVIELIGNLDLAKKFRSSFIKLEQIKFLKAPLTSNSVFCECFTEFYDILDQSSLHLIQTMVNNENKSPLEGMDAHKRMYIEFKREFNEYLTSSDDYLLFDQDNKLDQQKSLEFLKNVSESMREKWIKPVKRRANYSPAVSSMLNSTEILQSTYLKYLEHSCLYYNNLKPELSESGEQGLKLKCKDQFGKLLEITQDFDDTIIMFFKLIVKVTLRLKKQLSDESHHKFPSH